MKVYIGSFFLFIAFFPNITSSKEIELNKVDYFKFDCDEKIFRKSKTHVPEFFDKDIDVILGVCLRTGNSLDLLFLDAEKLTEVERVPIGIMSPYYSLEILDKEFEIKSSTRIKPASPKLINSGINKSKIAVVRIGPKEPIESPYVEVALVNKQWKKINTH